MRRTSVKALIFHVVFAFLATAGAQDGYDEIFDRNGVVRPHYADVYEVWSQLSEIEKERFLKESRRAFQGDNALDPMPRVIPAEEYDNILKKGVEQRGRALVAFLQDHYSGEKRYLNSNVVPGDVLERIIRRSQELGYEGKVNPKDIAFFYGPDIIRDPKGTWRVIEDNPGFIGGLGDLKLANQFLLSQLPGIRRAFLSRSPERFYKNLARIYHQRGAEHGGKVIMYMTPPYADNEDKRFSRILKEHGIETVTPNTRLQMVVKADGVYVYDSKVVRPKYEKVGFVIMNGEHWWLDPSHPVSYRRLVMMEVQSLLEEPALDKRVRAQLLTALKDVDPRTGEPDTERLSRILSGSNYVNEIPETLRKTRMAQGLTAAVFKGQVATNYSPGVDFIGDKEFYLYAEKLVRFYLGEEPILRNIETSRFSLGDSSRLDQKLFDRIFGDLKNYVVKKVDGRGGDAVWVGPKVSAGERSDLQERIRKNPAEYIVQRYTPLSHQNSNIVDLRVIADASSQGVFVTDTPWGRGLPANGNGKVNLSDQGREITVLVHDGPGGLCRALFIP